MNIFIADTNIFLDEVK